jgi:hypothetical protein
MGLAIQPFSVSVAGFGSYTYYAASRGKALAEVWRASLVCNSWSFKDFLRSANARRDEGHPQFGESITVCGKPAYAVYSDRQYVHFIRPDSEAVFSSHPYDVEPPEARRFTDYADTPDPEYTPRVFAGMGRAG